ncbi:RDD family protein [Agrococcus baldri]|uniref:RDD domain-containing protein n=1 Tax=Agrococcus baldri TaxID=153730 RepID=A0AA87URT2_9MICO|nr:RDD family protein [Agrococcus baldri]GEK79785.1 hypothetical protein ABA31_11360 [Agrococcus baldri]
MSWELPGQHGAAPVRDETGRPDAAYAAALGLLPAPLGRRALASAIELAAFAVLQLPYWIPAAPVLQAGLAGGPQAMAADPGFGWMLAGAGLAGALSLAFAIVQIVLHGRQGVTLGKAVTGIRSVNVATLGRPGIGRALARAVVLWLSFLVPVVGPILVLVSPVFDSRRRGRGWLDQVGATWFVDVANGLDPYHEKRMLSARKAVDAASAPAGSAAPRHDEPLGRPAQRYRPGELSGQARPAAPQTAWAKAAERPGLAISGGIVDSVPGRAHPPSPRSSPAPRPASAPSEISDETVVEPDVDGEIDESTVRRIEVHVADEPELDVTRARPRGKPVLATLGFDTGDRFDITGAALIGRNPSPSQGEVVEHLLPIADDTRSISKTHLLITAAPLAAVDRASTNGSSVVRAGTEHPLAPGEPFALVPGDVVRFGDRSVTVESAGGRS